MKNILQVLSGNSHFTGVASYLYQQYRHMDRAEIHYDFFLCKENSMESVMRDPIFSGSEFYVIHARTRRTHSTNYVRIMRELDRILNEKQYDAVVVNTSIVAIIYACMKVTAKHPKTRLIAHAHNTDLVLPKGALRGKIAPIMRMVDELFRRQIRKKAFALFACSREAGAVTFGTEAVKQKNFMVVRDAINLEAFRFNPQIRNKVRSEMGSRDECLVVGNVGSLRKRKNQSFLLEVFREIVAKRENAQLWIIGSGDDMEMLQNKASELGIKDKVLFLGQRTDVSNLMQGMDCFVFTTLSEGLGIVAIEAQAAGLPTNVSDGVPDDVLLSDLAQKIPLSLDAKQWAELVMKQMECFPNRADVSAQLREAGYDISSETARVKDYYCALPDAQTVKRKGSTQGK